MTRHSNQLVFIWLSFSPKLNYNHMLQKRLTLLIFSEYLIRFNFDLGPWTATLKGNSWFLRWAQIHLNQTIGFLVKLWLASLRVGQSLSTLAKNDIFGILKFGPSKRFIQHLNETNKIISCNSFFFMFK